ncbi:signal recognition particle-docking protein FtsY [uncultured Tateyamaria sp.]|uniref:signal recognition particle-docking protein FtsY n=1 Tax=uncultured Tateyamaria sp. TaxID=455651 RepID=UPI0026027E13|nr:signal recognition particle-docking protein FtsY [uncultured Tateyamaria sp.]
MAFFKKLKDRLFKSSSKIDEGLEAIVDDGGVEEQVEVTQVDPEEERAAEEARSADAARLAEEARAAEEVRLAEEVRQAEAARQADAARATEEAQRAAAEQAAAEARARAEAAAAEEERKAALAAAEALASEEEAAAARAAAEEAARVAAEEAANAAAEAARAAEERARAEAEQAEAARRAEEERVAQEAAARRAEAEAKEAERRAAAAALTEPTPSEPSKKPGLLGRLMGRTEAKTVVRRTLDDDMLEQLEELLIAADMGVDTALRVTANMAEGRMGRKLSVQEIKELMAGEIARIMEPVAKPLPLYPQTPQVVLVVGVNGSGKTTTIGKLASQFRAAGKSVVIAAGDTFRAAAVEQLQVWGDRAGVPVLTAPEGSDPASLAFEAMTKAQDSGADLLMIDTAGRLQNRGDLMEELAKIVRVIRKKDPSAPHNTLLVLDATTGQNALNQVKVFQEVSDVSGLVMTKLDGTAKGGVLVALADKFGLPIHAIGVGEQIDDLQPFDPEDFAAALTGLDIA